MWREKSVLFTLRKKTLVFDKVVTRHLIGLLESHDVKDRRCYVGKDTILYLGVLILRHVDKGHGVERVGSVGSAICILCIVGIAVVGDMMVS